MIVIGRGPFGTAIAERLRQVGHSVNHIGARELSDRAIPSPDWKGCTPIISVLKDDESSERVWRSIFLSESFESNTVCIESSTLTPHRIRSWSDEVLSNGGIPIECPLTGSIPGALSGNLNAFCCFSGSSAPNEFVALGKALLNETFEFSSFGEASAYKLIYNSTNILVLLALSSFVQSLEKYGLPKTQIRDLLERDKSWLTAVASSKLDRLLDANFQTPEFSIGTMLKDIKYRMNARLPVSSYEEIIFSQALSSNPEKETLELDFSAVLSLYDVKAQNDTL